MYSVTKLHSRISTEMSRNRRSSVADVIDEVFNIDVPVVEEQPVVEDQPVVEEPVAEETPAVTEPVAEETPAPTTSPVSETAEVPLCPKCGKPCPFCTA